MCLALELTTKRLFTIKKIWVEILFSLNKLILLHTVVVSHYALYKMAYLVKGGKAINSILYSLQETNIVTTGGTINI